MCSKGNHGRVLIDSLYQPLDQYLIDISIDTQLTLDQQSVDSRLSFDRLIRIDWKLVDSWPTVDQDTDGVSIENQPRCQWSVVRVSIEDETFQVNGTEVKLTFSAEFPNDLKILAAYLAGKLSVSCSH